jgi:hypothetical protein
LLGEFPENISRAFRVKKSIGIYTLKKVLTTSEDSGIDSDQRIKELANQNTMQFPVTNWNWYVTVAIEHELNIDKILILDRKFFWLEPKKALELEDNFYELTQVHLNRITSHLLNTIDHKFFSDVVLEGIFFCSLNKIPFGIPKFSSSAEVSGVELIESLDINYLRTNLSLLRKVPESEHRSLDSARHWYLTAIKEKDVWKKFLWYFLSLEILTNKMSEKLYDSVLNMIQLRQTQKSETESFKSVISELFPNKKNINLTSKFTIMSLGLIPKTTKEDLTNFKKVKKARDNLSHGALKRADKLPISLVSKLTEKYFRAAVKYQLANVQ